MKKVVKLFSLFIIMVISSINVVMADGCDDVIVSYGGGADINSYFGGYKIPSFSFSGSSNTKFTGYCHDPGITPTLPNGGSNPNMQCGRVIMDPTTNSQTDSIYDAGLVTILNSGKDYATVYKALNIYQMYWKTKDTTRANNENPTKEFRYWANYYMDNDADIKKALSNLRKTVGTNIVRDTALSNTKNPSDNADSMKGSRDLILNALNKANEYAKNGGLKLTTTDPIKVKNEKVENGITVYTQTITHKINIENFNSKTASVKIKFDCPKCASYGATVKFYLNDKEISYGDLITKNLASNDYIENGTGTVNFKMEFTANSNNYLCEDLDYSFKLVYYDESIDITAYDVSQRYNHNAQVQAFYIVAETENKKERTLTIDDTVSLCTANCLDLKKMCEEGSERACNRFQEEYNGECIFCSSNIPNLECKTCETGEHTLDIVEGYNVDPSNCNLPSSSDLNIRKCVANDEAIDSAGNKYKVTDLSNASAYANVYCKEDYHMTLPGTIAVDSGRYFTLNSVIKGTKFCYTNQITEGDLEGKIVEAAKESVQAWEDYQNLLNKKAAIDAGKTSKGAVGYHIEIESSSDGCGYQSYRNQNGIENTFQERKYRAKLVLVYDVTKCTWGAPGSCSTSKAAGSEELFVGDWSACNAFGTAYNEGQAASAWAPESYGSDLIGKIGSTYTTTINIGGGLESKGGGHSGTITYTGATGMLGELSVGTSSIYDIITEFNSATGYVKGSYSGSGLGTLINPRPFEEGWEMSYNFEPKMHFWYQERYMKNVLTDEMFVPKYDIETDVGYEYCVGNVSDDYLNCNNSSTGWKTELKEGETYKTENIWACDLDGCGWFSYIKSLVKYSKADLNATAEFITPTQFYTIFPSGTIVSARQGTEIENGEALVNGLPVELGSSGAKTYLLWVKDLGEYYNSNKLGRVWGNSNSVVSTNLKESNACRNQNSALVYDKNVDNSYFDSGLYACEYDVNICCPDCPPNIKNKCAVIKDDEGKEHFYDDKAQEVNEATYRIRCCPNGDCPVNCVNCLYNGSDIQVDYRQVTNENLNPNDRELGKNWSYDDQIDTALELKAYVTTKEIEEAGDSIYVNDDNDSNFKMLVTMDSELIKTIRDYNKRHSDEGYLNNTLKCYDLEYGDKVYKNIYCYSTFIDEILNDRKVSQNIQIKGVTRPSENERATKSNTYFTSWIDADLSDWDITTERGIEYYKTNFGKVYDENGKATEFYVGPSWK